MNKKIIASVLAVAFSVSMAGSANAITVEELQTQFNDLLTKFNLLLTQVGPSATAGTVSHPAGCTSAVGFSPTTGLSCSSVVTYPAGCTSAVGFSTTTGLSCSGTVVSYPPVTTSSITINSNPQADNSGNVTIKQGNQITITGVPSNLSGQMGVDYTRAFFFDSIFNNSCSNTDWVMTCTANQVGTSNFYIRLYKGNQIYQSNIIKVTVVAPTQITCTDSDGGMNIYVKGTASNYLLSQTDECTKAVWNGSTYQYNAISSCTGDGCFVDEAVCLTGSEQGAVGKGGSGQGDHACLYGCQDGACKPAVPVVTVSVDLKVNGSDNPAAVPYGSIFNASWTSTGATNCSASGHYIPLVGGGVWTDLVQLPTSGTKQLYAKHANYGYINPLQLTIQCWNNSTQQAKDEIFVNVTPAQIACTDSDGGKNYYVKGTTIGSGSGFSSPINEILTKTDSCWNCNNLAVTFDSCDAGPSCCVSDWYCDGYNLFSASLSCPNGCKDGACKSPNLPDLTILNITVDKTTLNIGETTKISATETNIGNVSAGHHYTGIFEDNIETPLNSMEINAIAPGYNPIINANYTCYRVGSHVITALVDFIHQVPTGEVSESNENNNSKTITINCVTSTTPIINDLFNKLSASLISLIELLKR